MLILGIGSSGVFNGSVWTVVSISKRGVVFDVDGKTVVCSLKETESMVM